MIEVGVSIVVETHQINIWLECTTIDSQALDLNKFVYLPPSSPPTRWSAKSSITKALEEPRFEILSSKQWNVACAFTHMHVLTYTYIVTNKMNYLIQTEM